MDSPPPPLRPGAALAVATLLAFLLVPSPGEAQTSASFAAWGQAGSGNVLDGMSLGMAHRSAGSGVFADVSLGATYSAAAASHSYAPGRSYHPGTTRSSYGHGYASYDVCWDPWDPWYGYRPACDAFWWTYHAWAPLFVTPVWAYHAPRYRSGFHVSFSFGWSSWGGWYDPWWGPSYHHYYWRSHRHRVIRPTYVYYSPRIYVVQPSVRVVHRPGYVVRDRGLGLRSAAPVYKEHPGAAPSTRTAVRRDNPAPRAAPSPDLRTHSTRTAVSRDDVRSTGAASADQRRATTSGPERTAPAERPSERAGQRDAPELLSLPPSSVETGLVLPHPRIGPVRSPRPDRRPALRLGRTPAPTDRLGPPTG